MALVLAVQRPAYSWSLFMKLFYSGDGFDYSQPEILLPEKESHLMLTFWHMHKKSKPTKRMRNIIKARKKRQRNES